MSPLRIPLTLSLVWWFGFGAFGFYLPYYALFLNENAGLTGSQAGAVLAVVPGIGVLGHAIWGRVADRTGRRTWVLATIALGCALGFLAIGTQSSFVGFLGATALLALFMPAFGPMTLSVCIAVLDEPGSHRLGRVRGWGTVGFAVVALSLPWLLRWAGGAAEPGSVLSPGLGMIFLCAAIPMFITAGVALCIPEVVAPRHERSHRGEWKRLVADRSFQRAMGFTFLVYFAIQGPMHLFPLLVSSHGGGVEAISGMWFWMLLLEVPLMFALGRSVGWTGPRAIIAIGAVAASIRWLVSGYTDDLQLLTVIQVLHGITVWGVMLGVPLYVDSLVPPRLRSTAQGLIAMVGPALGGVASNTLAGLAIEHFGGSIPARVGGWLALGCALLVPILLARAGTPEASPMVGPTPEELALSNED